MDSIRLVTIEKKESTVVYKFVVSANLQKYFSGENFVIEYPENIENVPDSILTVPFAGNVLPIIWLTDSQLIIDNLDEDFFYCIHEIKKGYQTLFPETVFKGEILVNNITKNKPLRIAQKSAMFYSGGLDSTHTLISHLDERPDLISIWGSDIGFKNTNGWEAVHSHLAEVSEILDLNEYVIHSSFREFDNERELDRVYKDLLKDGWWHGVKHGIALLSHVAPLSYINGYSLFYIASSNCVTDVNVRCASHPLMDNQVRFASCRVIHDGFEITRQDKTRDIISFCRENKIAFPLHVCWESQQGGNCCKCEKCLRTIVGIIAERGNPENFGFCDYSEGLPMLQSLLVLNKDIYYGTLQRPWTYIQKRLKENRTDLRNDKSLGWIFHADFKNPGKLKMPLIFRMKNNAFVDWFYIRYQSLLQKKRDISLIRKKKINRNSIFLIGTSEHTNIGDSAIALAEVNYLKACGFKSEDIVEITQKEYITYESILLKRVNKFRKCLVCLQGGGNMGNQYPPEELFRRKVLENIEAGSCVIFPQTFFYASDVYGEKQQEQSLIYYEDKDNLTIAAREKDSFRLMKEIYPNTKIILTPDIVLSNTSKDFDLDQCKRSGVLFVMRMDEERSMKDIDRDKLKCIVSDYGYQISVTDMLNDTIIKKEDRLGVVKAKMEEFASCELVITDRLHGMIFASITGTPCIVFSNYNHKVKGSYDWISYLPYIKYAQTVEQATEYISELLNMDNCEFDNGPLLPYFDELKDVIRNNW